MLSGGLVLLLILPRRFFIIAGKVNSQISHVRLPSRSNSHAHTHTLSRVGGGRKWMGGLVGVRGRRKTNSTRHVNAPYMLHSSHSQGFRLFSFWFDFAGDSKTNNKSTNPRVFPPHKQSSFLTKNFYYFRALILRSSM